MICPKCNTEFEPRRAGSGGQQCPECRRQYQARWRAANPDKTRAYRASERAADPYFYRRRILQKHGLTPARFETLLDAQDHACAICRTQDPGARGWHIDHDHACCPGGDVRKCGQCVRGLLCHGCNVGLGMFREDPSRLRSAIEYLGGFDL